MKATLPILALISLTAFALPSRAADERPLATPAPTVHPTDWISFNVDFPGGSIGRLLTAIGKIDGISFNIIAANDAPEFSQVELPAFTLRNVSLITVAEVLRTLLETRGYNLRTVGGGPNPNSMVLVLTRTEAPKPPRKAQVEFMSVQLAPYLQAQSVDDIVSAIRAAWELDPAHDAGALKLKFHPGTSILLMSGPGEALHAASGVVLQLRRSPIPEPKPEPKSPPAGEPEKK